MPPAKTDAHDGFSLIELMVVILVIAILLAIAIPTFLGARSRAQNREAQSRARNAYVAEQIYNADANDDSGAPEFTEDIAELRAIEPQLIFLPLAPNGVPTDDESVFIDVVDGPDPDTVADDLVIVASKSKAGRCYWIRTFPSPGLPRFAQNDCESQPGEASALWTSRWRD